MPNLQQAWAQCSLLLHWWRQARCCPWPISWPSTVTAAGTASFTTSGRSNLTWSVMVRSRPTSSSLRKQISTSSLLATLLKNQIQMQAYKGTVQRDFNSVLWHIWIDLGLNMNRFFAFKTFQMLPRLKIKENFLHASKENPFWKRYGRWRSYCSWG